jgi:hypothetical protein
VNREAQSGLAGGSEQSFRERRWLSVVVGICAVGAAVVITPLVWRQVVDGDTPQPAAAAKVISEGREVPLSTAVIRVATIWILGAVTRADLAGTYALTDPDIRGSMSRIEWEHGIIPVVAYPVGALSTKSWRIVFSRAKAALLEVRLVPTAGIKAVLPRTFLIALKLVGGAGSRHWVVSYWSHKIQEGAPVSGSSS